MMKEITPGRPVMPPPPPTPAPATGPLTRLKERVQSTRPWVRWVVMTAILGAVGGGVAVGVVAYQKSEDRRRVAVAAEEWARFDRAANAGDSDEMLAALDALAPLTPDPAVARYREVVESGEAPADDPRLCRLTMTLHARRRGIAAAAREGEKLLVHEPDDWAARCLAALAAVEAGNPTEAARHLDRLPDPSRAGPTPAGLLLAADLFRRTGRDAAPLRRFVNDVVVEVIGSVGVADDPPARKVELLDCYLLGFSGPPDAPLPGRLATGMAAAVRLADDVAASDDAAVLVRLGGACDRLAAAMSQLERAGQITPAQRAGLAAEHDARTAKVWGRVKAISPATLAAYRGLAAVGVRAGRLDAAVDEVRNGLTACGDDPGLLAMYSLLLRATGRTPEALRTVAAAAEADPTNVSLLLLVADTALAAPRLDVAEVAVRQAEAVAPDDPRVVRADVRLQLAAGDPHRAVQRLRDLGEPVVLADPALVRVYAMSLADAGLGVLIPDLLAAVEKRANAVNDPAGVAAAGRGLADAAYDPSAVNAAVTAVDRSLSRWSGDTGLLVARGLLLTRRAEDGDPRWDPTHTREAAFALDRLRAVDPDDPAAAALLARVRLHGQNDPAAAARAVAPLVAARDQGGLLPPDQLTVLGEVLLATGEPEKAVAALEQARVLGPPTAGVLIPLAKAYHALGDTTRGRQVLAEARPLPRTPHDNAALLALPAPLRDAP